MNHLEATEAQATRHDHFEHRHSVAFHRPRPVVETVTQLESENISLGESFTPELTGCAGSFFCNPYAWGHKIIAIFFMCLMGFGSYLCYDVPGALIDVFKDVMNVGDSQYGLLYALYSWPNVVLPVVGGYLIDRVFGLRVASVVFISFCIVGQFLLAVGAFVDSFLLMEFSRFVYGLGGESLAVAQSTYAAAWFKGNALNAVFGLQLSISRVGSTAAFQAGQPVYNATLKWQDGDGHKALGWTLVILGLSTVLSGIGAIVIGLLDKRKAVLTGSYLEEQPRVNLKEVLRFPLSVWLVCFVCVTFYVAIFPFVSFGKDMYKQRYSFNDQEANSINGLIYLISAVASPLFGFLIDRVGWNIYFVLMADILTLAGHSLLGFTMITPYAGVVLIGMGYSMLAGSLWPIVALIVPEHRQGTAYGVVQAVQNLGLALIQMLMSWVKETSDSNWPLLEGLYVAFLGAATLGTLGLLWSSHKQHMGYLHMTTKTRDKFETTKAYFDMMQKVSGTEVQPEIAGGVENPNFDADENLIH